ncbi:TIGR02266 family protein [Stigmatella aurantiaca]|uniref:Type IV pilus assembly protein PilZ n=1 Tax=Stigmatella aurantiaca (strain DW4/3-1) TaxID=378806 RepID=Q09CZ5_STIAD|nr:TIGR02266 family protein [Stigmatella aurantiaca]ADO67919.1 Type IV pilus assembly protein PilZ [Stigmatella aurantiaca DW4/3-1]EAU69693.1 type IV pilus assembly protein PilZ [Stigmatella aurantiaca DW4/3-1]
MRPPSNTFPRPIATREAELARAEAELSALETRTADQVSRAATEATTLANRLSQVRTELAQAQSEHVEDVSLPEIGARLQAAAIPELAVEVARDRAITARREALEVRTKANEEVQIALHAFLQQTQALTRELAEAETRLKNATEAARLRRQQEEARARQPPPPPPSSRPTGLTRRTSATPVPMSAAPAPSPTAKKARGRVRLQAQIHLNSDSNFFAGFSSDVLTGGLFVATVETVPRGTPVDLDFTLPGGRPHKVSGVVRWLREPNDRMPDLMPGMGVQFQDVPPEVASAISSFVAKREPLFYPD